MALLKLKGDLNMNSGKAINEIKVQLLALQEAGGDRDWVEWNHVWGRSTERKRFTGIKSPGSNGSKKETGTPRSSTPTPCKKG